MIILEKTLEGIVIGRNPEFPIAAFMFNLWNGTINTVLVGKETTDDETELMRKIAYQYAEKINKGFNGNIRDEMFNIFQESFDEYQMKNEKELVNDLYFTKAKSRFIKNVYDSPQDAADEIIKKVKDVSGVSISIDMSEKGSIVENTVYTVSLDNDSSTEFTFWKSNDWPREKESPWNLHIVPDYHPSSPSQGGKSCNLLINGATDGLIGATAISSVYSPKEAREREDVFGTSWYYIRHPYKVTGKSFRFTLKGFYHATQELVDDAVQLIVATLGIGEYVGISQGFKSTYDAPGNIANRTGRQLPRNPPRGSENHCMWTYDVLKQENQLEEAFIPDWFTKENWLEFFEGQEGIFLSL